MEGRFAFGGRNHLRLSDACAPPRVGDRESEAGPEKCVYYILSQLLQPTQSPFHQAQLWRG